MIKKLLLLLLFLGIATSGFAAEFLIRARNNWMIDADKTGWTVDKIANAEMQYKIGDVVAIHPDQEKLLDAYTEPAFYLIHAEGLKYEDALKYQEQWNEEVEKETTCNISIAKWDDPIEKEKMLSKLKFVGIPSIVSADTAKGLYQVTGTQLVTQMKQKRKFNIRVLDLPKDTLDKLKEKRVVSMKWEDLKPYLFNKVTSTNEK